MSNQTNYSNATKCVYTVICWNPEKNYELREPKSRLTGWDYICFTDDPKRARLKTKSWHIEKLEIDEGLSLRQNSRVPKILFNEFDLSLYLDCKFVPDQMLNMYARRMFGDDIKWDMGLMLHSKNNCVYKEAEITGYGDSAQIKRYKKEGLPGKQGLYAPGIMWRHHNDRVNAMMKTWYEEYSNGCERDQISLAYTVWKHPEVKIKGMKFKKTYDLFRHGKKQ